MYITKFLFLLYILNYKKIRINNKYVGGIEK